MFSLGGPTLKKKKIKKNFFTLPHKKCLLLREIKHFLGFKFSQCRKIAKVPIFKICICGCGCGCEIPQSSVSFCTCEIIKNFAHLCSDTYNVWMLYYNLINFLVFFNSAFFKNIPSFNGEIYAPIC